MSKPALPKLNLDDTELPNSTEEDDEESKIGTRIFNMRLYPETIKRIQILKKDPTINALSWNKFLELIISLFCQNGLALDETIQKLKKAGMTGPAIPKEMKLQYGLGTKWVEVQPTVEKLKEETERTGLILSDLEEALYEFITAIEASEMAEETLEPEIEEELEEESLFNVKAPTQIPE